MTARRLTWAGLVLTGLALAACEECPTLDERLSHLFDRYQRVGPQAAARLREAAFFAPLVTSAQWEELITPEPACAPTGADANELRRRHAAAEAEAKVASSKRSGLSIEALRADSAALERFCDEVPKGGVLHLHPRRSLDRPTLRTLLEKDNPVVDGAAIMAPLKVDPWTAPERVLLGRLAAPFRDLPPADQTALMELFFLPTEPFTHGEARVRGISALLDLVFPPGKATENLATALAAYAQRVQPMGISYLEPSVGVGLGPRALSRLQTLARRIHDTTGIYVRFKKIVFRTASAAESRVEAQTIIDVFSSRQVPEDLVGIDFCGDEFAVPTLAAGHDVFAALLLHPDIPLKKTIHIGGRADAHIARDALIWRADQLATGAQLYADPVTLEYARRRRTSVQITLGALVRKGGAPSFESIPFVRYQRLGLPVTLATGDEGVIGSSMAQECVHAVSHSDVTYHELKEMFRNSLRESFAEPPLKEKLLTELDRSLASFEQRWLPILPATVQVE